MQISRRIWRCGGQGSRVNKSRGGLRFERGVRAVFWKLYAEVDPMDDIYELFVDHLALHAD